MTLKSVHRPSIPLPDVVRPRLQTLRRGLQQGAEQPLRADADEPGFPRDQLRPDARRRGPEGHEVQRGHPAEVRVGVRGDVQEADEVGFQFPCQPPRPSRTASCTTPRSSISLAVVTASRTKPFKRQGQKAQRMISSTRDFEVPGAK
jgi:hypothetical protein